MLGLLSVAAVSVVQEGLESGQYGQGRWTRWAEFYQTESCPRTCQRHGGLHRKQLVRQQG